MGRRFGKFDILMRFERNAPTGSGVNLTESWSPLVNLWGRRLYPQGGAGSWKHAENQDLPDEILHFECRYYDGFNSATDRVLVNGVYYELLSPEEFGRKESTRFVAKKRIDA